LTKEDKLNKDFQKTLKNLSGHLYKIVYLEIIDEFVDFMEQREGLTDENGLCLQGFTVRVCCYMLFFIMTKPHEVKADTLRLKWNLEKNFIQRLFKKFNPHIMAWNEAKLQKPLDDELRQQAQRIFANGFQDILAILDGTDNAIKLS
jgi:hypothetical protein